MSTHTTFCNLPNTSFGIALGFGGNCVLWRAVRQTKFNRSWMTSCANWLFFILGTSAWILLALGQMIKIYANRKLAQKEWSHTDRVYFFFAPHLSLLMLALGIPETKIQNLIQLRRTIFIIGLIAQIMLCLIVYARWLYSKYEACDLNYASPAYLLATVGWPLLTVLAQELDLTQYWRIDIAALCIGPGIIFYALAFASIMHSMPQRHVRGAPILFLIVAPPSVIAIALANFAQTFHSVPIAVFGFALFEALVLLRLGPKLFDSPETLGTYYAYTFPSAALATAAVRFAQEYNSELNPTRILAWILVFAATLSLFTVITRMSIHMIAVATNRAVWTDPLLTAPQSNQQAVNQRCDLELDNKKQISTTTKKTRRRGGWKRFNFLSLSQKNKKSHKTGTNPQQGEGRRGRRTWKKNDSNLHQGTLQSSDVDDSCGDNEYNNETKIFMLP